MQRYMPHHQSRPVCNRTFAFFFSSGRTWSLFQASSFPSFQCLSRTCKEVNCRMMATETGICTATAPSLAAHISSYSKPRACLSLTPLKSDARPNNYPFSPPECIRENSLTDSDCSALPAPLWLPSLAACSRRYLVNIAQRATCLNCPSYEAFSGQPLTVGKNTEKERERKKAWLLPRAPILANPVTG